eukprot:7738427-Ditylum_brightwellii.AAC.1
MSGYVSYFQDDHILNLGHGYHVGLCGYVGRQETSAINLGTLSNTSVIKPGTYSTLEEMHL